jgi:hypothetical protein
MKNNTIQIYLMLLLCGLVLFFSSCEEVIDLDLNSANPNIVIEANITDLYEEQVVKISLTKGFGEDNSIVPVNNAIVTAQEENGPNYVFTKKTADGQYYSPEFIGKSGVKYTVQVIVNNKTYTAESVMPERVNLDSLSLTSIVFFGDVKKFVQIHYNDPGATNNYYNCVLTVNDKVRNAFYPEEDRFNNGNKVVNTIFNADPSLASGDKVIVDFQCINQNIYKYFFSISQISGNGGPPTAPSNPDSNFNNGALGYFSAHTSKKMEAIIP